MATRLRLPPAERRAQLLELGVELFSARPYDDFSLDELAARAGVSKGLLYHYWPTKKDLYVAALREATGQMLALVEPPAGLASEEALRAGLDAYLAYVEDHAGAYRAVLRGGIGSDPDVLGVADDFRRAIHDRVLEAGGLGGAPALVRTAVRAWIGMVEAASLELIEEPGRLRRSELVELLARALPAVLAAAARD